jgi:hypothetical protein
MPCRAVMLELMQSLPGGLPWASFLDAFQEMAKGAKGYRHGRASEDVVRGDLMTSSRSSVVGATLALPCPALQATSEAPLQLVLSHPLREMRATFSAYITWPRQRWPSSSSRKWACGCSSLLWSGGWQADSPWGWPPGGETLSPDLVEGSKRLA